jgi:hypothetical protein
MLKKTILAVLGLTANGLALAGSMGPVCTPGNVTVPCETKLWSLGLDALYFNLNNGNIRGYRSTNTRDRVTDEWSWGFRAEGAYQYSTGNDASVSWIHISNDNRQDNLVSFDPTNPLEGLNSETRFDQVNAVLGQHFSASATNKVRLYSGLSYARIENDQSIYNTAFARIGLARVNDESYFYGVGPVLGVDYSYYVSNDLSLVSNGATSLLYGMTNASHWINPNAFPTLSVNPSYASKNAVVPGFEAKLGLNYAYTMSNGTLNLEGGYQAIQYIAPLQAFRSGLVVSSDFGVYGPYFGAKYVGNV